jgi:hypothetical protein
MTRTVALAALLALPVLGPKAAPPAPPLGALPSIPRVRIDVAHDHLLAVEEVDLPRGDWRGGDLDFYVAFGGPGPPEAFDAHLVPVADGALEPEESEAGEKIAADRAARRGAGVHELIGREDMAGMTVHVTDAAFRRALAPGGMAALRLRSLVRLPDEGPEHEREVLVRLGSTRSAPLTLGRLQVGSLEANVRVLRAEARLCGPDADPWPLAVQVLPGPPAMPPAPGPRPIAPVLSVRHPSDDLCVRFWVTGP